MVVGSQQAVTAALPHFCLLVGGAWHVEHLNLELRRAQWLV